MFTQKEDARLSSERESSERERAGGGEEEGVINQDLTECGERISLPSTGGRPGRVGQILGPQPSREFSGSVSCCPGSKPALQSQLHLA